MSFFYKLVTGNIYPLYGVPEVPEPKRLELGVLRIGAAGITRQVYAPLYLPRLIIVSNCRISKAAKGIWTVDLS